MTERDIRVTGMTCAACESTVAGAFAALPGVDSATASARTGVVRIIGRSLPADATLAAGLADTPYRLGASRWLANDRSVWQDVALGVAAVGVLFLAISAWNPGSRMAGADASLTVGTALLVLGLGVAASLSTCMALVGGLVLSLAASVRTSSASRASAVATQTAFNVGRILGFGVLGAAAGAIGQSFALRGLPLAIAMVVVALATAVLGIRLTEISPRLAAWQVTLPSSWSRWARHTSADTDSLNPRPQATARPYLRAAGLGAATFFLPCGFTQVVQLLALSSGSPTTGGTLMALFALGTTPGLFTVGMAASSARRSASRRPLRIIGVIVIAFAVVTGAGGLTGTGLLAPDSSVTATERTSNVVDVGGRQVVKTDIGPKGYFPADAVVYVNEPVTWVLNSVGVGCASLVEADELGLGELNAIFDEVSSEFTPTKTGVYRFHCAMGMYSGSFTVIDRPASAANATS